MQKLFITSIFVIIITHAFAQPATNVSPQNQVDGKFIAITSDKKGDVYTVYENNGSISFYARDNHFWKKIKENIEDPGVKIIHKIIGLSSGFVVFGQTYSKQQVVAVWKYGKWSRLPVKELQGKINALAVDDANVIWLSGEFNNNERTAWLANWENNKFTLSGPSIPADRKLQNIFKTGNENLFVTGSASNTIYLQLFDEKEQQRFFLTTEGNTWNTLMDNSIKMFNRDAVAVDKNNLYVVIMCDGVDKCVIKWSGDKWMPVPMNDSFRNDKIQSITFDNKGKLLIAGYTKADKDYSILEWDGNNWKQYGSQIKWNYKQIADGNKEVYAITGNGEYVVRVPEDHNKHDLRLTKKEPKALRFYQLFIEYLAEELADNNTMVKAYTEYTKEVNRDRHQKIDYFRTVVQSFREMIQRTEVAISKEELKRGENRMADYMRERIVLKRKTVYHLKEAAEALGKKDFAGSDKFMADYKIATKDLDDHIRKNARVIADYIQENGL